MTLHRTELRTVVSLGFPELESRLQTDEDAALRSLLEHSFTHIERHVRHHGGTVFRKEAEGLWCSFPSPLGALRSVAAILRDPGSTVVRAGAHTGGVTLTANGDVLGHTLSVAKRLETACPTGSALISQDLVQRLGNRACPLQLQEHEPLELKGVGTTQAWLGQAGEDASSELWQALWLFQLDGLEPEKRIELERLFLKEPGQNGWLQETVLWWQPPSGKAAIATDGLPRCLLLHGPLLISGLPHGSIVEHGLQALEAGWQKLTLVHGQAANLLPKDSWLEPYLSVGEELFYRVGEPGELQFSHHPRVVRSWRDGKPFDVVASAGVEAAETARALGEEPDLEVPAHIARLASSKRLTVQEKRALEGRVAPGGELLWTERSARPCAHKDELEAWLRGEHLRETLQRLQPEHLIWLVFGPSVAELESLAPGAEDFYEAAEELEIRKGREQLQSDYESWCAGLPELDWTPPAGGLRFLLFPDPRYEQAGFHRLGEVLTQADREQLCRELPQLLAPWKSQFSTHPVIVVGPYWEDVFRALREHFPASPDQIQLKLGEKPDELKRRWWARRNVECVELAPAAFLDELERTVPCCARLKTQRAPDRPYKFLDYYGSADAAIFFGRDKEVEDLLALIVTRPLVILYGRSGVGKTSLLRAGVLPRLGPPQNLTLTVRCLSDPLQLLKTELSALLNWSSPEHSLQELCQAVEAQVSGHLVILLDQFEEFFIRISSTGRELFRKELARLKLSRTRLVFSLREDFLAEMSEFEQDVPHILDHRLRLTALSDEQARKALTGPAELFGLEVEPALADALLAELRGDGIDPPELQIVLDRLYEAREMPGDRMTLERYHSLGGVRSILLDYLHDTLDAELRQGPWPEDLPRKVLKSLVTERGTKSVVTLEDVAEETRAGVEQVFPLLERLVQCRLARVLVGEDGRDLFELAHEYLIEEILGWATQEELAARHAQMVLSSELESWNTLQSLMTADRLELVRRERTLLKPQVEERRLLLRASAVHGQPLQPWLESDDADFLLSLLDEPLQKAAHRRVLETLLADKLESRAVERCLLAAERCGNPTLLENLSLKGKLKKELLKRVRRRFFQDMCKVPGGPALLGSTGQEKAERKAALPRYQHGRVDSERELGPVEVETFWIDRTCVTNELFAEYRSEHANRYPADQAAHPVVSVSWHDAQQFAAWLGKELPSEEQWEKAARGEDGRLYPWGDAYDPERLNAAEGGRRSTTSVDAFPEGASPYGCLNMAGNVWEWTASGWAGEGPFKTQKGGSTLNPAAMQTCSSRMEAFPDFVLQWVGFRLAVRELPEL